VAILVDTNVLLRSVQPVHPMHAVALQAIRLILQSGEPTYVAIQNMAEFWNALTRPLAYNGLGFSVDQARKELERMETFFQVLNEDENSYEIWKRLVVEHQVSGAQVHDARLAAVMQANSVERILTFNVSDFRRFTSVIAVHPEAFA